MMAVRALVAPDLKTSASFAPFAPLSPYSDSPWPHSATVQRSQMSVPEQKPQPSLSPADNATAPPDPTAPSPISSDTGTEFADVDDVDVDAADTAVQPVLRAQTKPSPIKTSFLKIETSSLPIANKQTRSDEDEPPASVIYAPAGFGAFHAPLEPANPKATTKSTHANQQSTFRRTDSRDSTSSDATLTQDSLPESTERFYDSQVPPTPLQTSLPSIQDWISTPRAQTRQELGAASRPGSSLASITEGDDNMSDHVNSEEERDLTDANGAFFRREQDEVKALNNALTECWTLCNTLAGLSYVHRERIFGLPGTGSMQQQAWKSCWMLCQNLYSIRGDDAKSDVRPTLELTRDFCQALFDVRVRDNETADSVLRVSFELNNHLFNTHDRNLPEAFRERTLDFYVTLCHRLMKQKSKMAEETDSLLKACWTLAEMLFSLRQVKNEGRKADDELLGSAVQACWDLCDLFRDGWVQIRPERQTPRPSQATFTQAFQEARQSGTVVIDQNGNKINPETPTTIFDDSTTDSPYEAPAPNIVVLGTIADSDAIPSSAVTASTLTNNSLSDTGTRQTAYRWPTSTNLTLTTNSAAGPNLDPRSNSRSSSVHTERANPGDDQALVLLKSLFVRAAVLTKRGFEPKSTINPSSSPRASVRNSLPQFVKSLPDTAFGAQTWQMHLLIHYQKAVVNDPTFKVLGPAANPRLIEPEASTMLKVRQEVAQAVKVMVTGTSGWSWLKDLFRYSFGVYVDEVLGDKATTTVNTNVLQKIDTRNPNNRRPTQEPNGIVNHNRKTSDESIASNTTKFKSAVARNSTL